MQIKKMNRNWRHLACASAILLSLGATPNAVAGDSPYIGDVIMFAGNFCPRGWADTSGQLLAISEYEALFSLLGTIYGGDGRTTFGLPDLRGRVLVGEGSGAGLTQRRMGEKAGSENFSITANSLGGHTHTASTSNQMHASAEPGTVNAPGGNVLANDGDDDIYTVGEPSAAQMRSDAVTSTTTLSATGSSMPVYAQQPYIGIRSCIALFGIYPSRT